METPRYLHLKPGEAPPQLESPLVDGEVTPEWQAGDGLGAEVQ
jgi:hypothetical protein